MKAHHRSLLTFTLVAFLSSVLSENATNSSAMTLIADRLVVNDTVSDKLPIVEDTAIDRTSTTEEFQNVTEDVEEVRVVEVLEVLESSKPTLSEHLVDLKVIQGLLSMSTTTSTAAPVVVTTPSSLEQLLDVYNPHVLAEVWGAAATHVTPGCNHTMSTYLDALQRGTTWARKMSDASGRYSAGFLWGNSYWSGSATLCEATGDHEGPVLHSVPLTTSSLSPFPLGFYSLRLEIMTARNITPTPRTVLLGLCLPRVCTGLDAHRLVLLSTEAGTTQREVSVVNVRSPHEYYDMTDDPTFWMLVAFSAVTCAMLLAGTVYDLFLESSRSTSFIASNYTYEVTRASKTAGNDALNNNDTVETKGKINKFTNIADSEAAMVGEFCPDTNLCMFSKVLLAFSIRRNMLTICDRSVGSDTIPTIHGLRSISMTWVILGHTCIVIFKYSDNTVFREVVETNFLFQTISNGTFSVDTFFFISGLLVAFLYFRTTAKMDITKLTKTTGFKSNLLQFVGMLLYRFARLTVPYMFVLGAVEVTMKWFYFNSVFEAPTLDHINCPKYWWRNILYINTLFPVEDMCMLWSWYLADDTQFYIIGAVLLIVAVRHFRVSAVALALFMVSSWCTTAYIAYSNDHMPNLDDPLALFDKIYDKPWTRLGPYLVGMSVGWILFKTDCKIRMTKLAVCAGWLCSSACLLALVYGLYNAQLSPLAAAAYSSLSHTAWALSLAWIVIACSTGYGGYVNSLLSMSILYPFSRVTYCAYLIHPIVVRIMVMRIDSPLHLATNSVMILFFGQVVCSYILSFVVSLSFEAPIVSLLRLVSPTKQMKNQ